MAKPKRNSEDGYRTLRLRRATVERVRQLQATLSKPTFSRLIDLALDALQSKSEVAGLLVKHARSDIQLERARIKVELFHEWVDAVRHARACRNSIEPMLYVYAKQKLRAIENKALALRRGDSFERSETASDEGPVPRL